MLTSATLPYVSVPACWPQHGFHLGEFGAIMDKRLPYETDIRIPFFIRSGPARTHLPRTAGLCA